MTENVSTDERHAAGVIGVGSMGQHHARVYSEMPNTRLVGVADTDAERAIQVADEYGSSPMGRDELLDAADLVSVAVPTRYHAEVVQDCIETGTDVLVEKPFVDDRERGRELAADARQAGIVIQVGHIERFNPAVEVLADIVPDLDIVSVDIDRLGPPLDRDSQDNVVMDLMIHDVDILLSLVDEGIETLSAVARDDQHATAQFGFENGTVATVTASRRTQEKIRTLAITAESCRVNVDFISQSVEIHRRSLPEFVESNGDIRYRHESVVERPMIENGEPLKAQLESFVEAAETDTEPRVTAEDALAVLGVIERIEKLALGPVPEVSRP
ncbi:MAG: Gfo/Idh/MocA family oxidoreductase [Halolamina sp.]